MPEPQTEALWAQNDRLLARLVELIGELREEDYCKEHPVIPDQSVGRHLRHALEHYQAFVQGLAEGCIDYSRRDREVLLEQHPVLARERINWIRTELGKALDNPPQALWMVPDLEASEVGQDPAVRTDFARELAFLSSHAVHHMAQMRLLLAERGIFLEASFGVAVATLRDRGEPGGGIRETEEGSVSCAS